MPHHERPAYAAVTFDIVGSTRHYEQTGEPLRPRLQQVLAVINDRFRDALAVPFSVIIGDECQGLVADLSACPLIVHEIRLQLAPLKCRVGVGVGTVVSEPAASTIEMEGEAFARSRDALDAAKASGDITIYRLPDEWLERQVNSFSALIDAVQAGWTAKQWEAVRAVSHAESGAAAGQQLGLSRQTFHDRLSRTQWRYLRDALHELGQMLGRFGARSSL